MEIARFGSLYLDSEVAKPMFERMGVVDIALGDTIPGNELLWVQDGDRFIADRCVCTFVSWDRLNEGGYIYMADRSRLTANPTGAAVSKVGHRWAVQTNGTI